MSRRPTLRRPVPAAGRPRAIPGTRTRLRWVDDPAGCGLRYVGDWDDVIRRARAGFPRHFAWTIDHGENVWGVVYRLPGGRGFVPGIALSHNRDPAEDGPAALALCSPPAETAEEAAWHANDLAQWYAEAERDREAAWQAGALAGEAAREAEDERESLLAWLRDTREQRRALRGPEAESIRAALRHVAAAMLARLYEARCRRDALIYERPHRPDLREAWHEGFAATGP